MAISIVYITNRYEPHVEWMLDSLLLQFRPEENAQFIVVAPEHSNVVNDARIQLVRPKPTIWSGPHRLTKQDWWSAANARNTGICYAKGEWIVFLDDRSMVLPGWADHLRCAIRDNYAVYGSYQKVQNLVVEQGSIKSYDKDSVNIFGKDSRQIVIDAHWKHLQPPYECPGEWSYGCCIAAPREWILEINGFDETCDGLRYEDSFFGLMLKNTGHAMKFDPRMMVIEDRTSGECGPDVRGIDKGKSPHDKSHALLRKLRHLKRTLLPPGLREMREAVLRGEPFPPPTSPLLDWYDGQPVSEM